MYFSFAILCTSILHYTPTSKKDFKSDYIPNFLRKLEIENFDEFPSVGVSLGFSIYPDDGQDFQELIQIAGRAMYKAKGREVTI